jgi:hypothetical protein
MERAYASAFSSLLLTWHMRYQVEIIFIRLRDIIFRDGSQTTEKVCFSGVSLLFASDYHQQMSDYDQIHMDPIFISCMNYIGRVVPFWSDKKHRSASILSHYLC